MSICTACGHFYQLAWTEPDENGRRKPVMHCPLEEFPIRMSREPDCA